MLSFLKKLVDLELPLFKKNYLAVDLGTSNTRIAIKNKGVVFYEPTFIGYNNKTKEVIFFGTEAKEVLGKTPEFVKIIKPLANGIIYDFDFASILIKKCLKKSVEPYFGQGKFLKPTLTCVSAFPYIATEIERKAVEEVLIKSGCSSVLLIDRAIATARGCLLDIFSHQPHLIVDLGGGLIEISIVSGGGVVTNKTLKNAGENMDKLIANYLYLRDGIILGESTCEKLKISLLNFSKEEKIQVVRGKSLESGLPKTIKVNSNEIKEAVLTNFYLIIETVKELLEASAPEIVDEIYNSGIYLTGGLASIPNVAEFFSQELKIKVNYQKEFSQATINGLLAFTNKKSDLERISLYHNFVA